MHHSHRTLSELVVRGDQTQLVKFSVQPYKADIVVPPQAFVEGRRRAEFESDMESTLIVVKTI